MYEAFEENGEPIDIPKEKHDKFSSGAVNLIP